MIVWKKLTLRSFVTHFNILLLSFQATTIWKNQRDALQLQHTFCNEVCSVALTLLDSDNMSVRCSFFTRGKMEVKSHYLDIDYWETKFSCRLLELWSSYGISKRLSKSLSDLEFFSRSTALYNFKDSFFTKRRKFKDNYGSIFSVTYTL